MSQSEIDEKLADVARRFNDGRAQKDKLDADLKDIDAELFRLQGEHRVLTAMKEPNDPPTIEEILSESDPAKTVKAEARKNG